MSDESDFRNVLARAAEGGAFDDCWRDGEIVRLPGGDLETWRERCLNRASEIATPPEGMALSPYVESVLLGGGRFRPRFVLVPKKGLDVGAEKTDNEATGETTPEENENE